MREEKTLRWHIDYLLEQARMEGIRLYPERAADECAINNHTARVLGGTFPVKGFGSSDCRCTSHLMLIPETGTVDLDVVLKSRR